MISEKKKTLFAELSHIIKDIQIFLASLTSPTGQEQARHGGTFDSFY